MGGSTIRCMPTRPLRERNRRRVRDEIGDSAVELFVRHGVAEVSVDQVAEAAGVSRSTAFRHFPVKEDMALVWHDRMVERIDAELADRGGFDLEAFGAQLRETFLVADPHQVGCWRLLAAEPTIRARAGARGGELAEVVARHIAARGHDPARARLLAGLCSGVMGAARDLGGPPGPSMELGLAVLGEALAPFGLGPVPAVAPRRRP